ncbi:MAG: DNA polymerase beta superfamily protein [Candidatus Methylumidiphilus sp.]
MTEFKIVQMKVGSHLYGTATPESDLDIKAVYIPSARDILLQRVSPVVSENRIKARGEKNTSADTDCEAFSLQRYLDLLAEGQTVALDMLFAPEWAMLEPPHALWHDIKTLAPRIMTKGTTAMVRYCRQQANKYGIKGLRVAAARAALGVLQEAEQTHGGSAKLETVADELEALAVQSEYLGFVDMPNAQGETLRFFDICGKKSLLTASIQNARLIAERLVDGYGRRAMEAERSDGMDWKALSHAVRIGQEAVELFRTGQITFPRPEAAHLLAVKQGKVPYAEVAEEIESLVDEVEKAASDSGFPDKADMQLVDDLIFRVYRQQILGELQP